MMKEAHECGSPVMRTLFYEFPEDSRCWEEKESYLFGGDLLVHPVTEEGAGEASVYLPEGCRWKDAWTKEEYDGGLEVKVQAPLDRIPLFIRMEKGREVPGCLLEI